MGTQEFVERQVSLPDRRREARCSDDRSVRLHRSGERGRALPARLVEWSPSGCRIELQHALEAGGRVTVLTPTREIRARVAWANQKRNHYHAGLQISAGGIDVPSTTQRGAER